MLEKSEAVHFSKNVSHGIQSEGLKLLEGTYIDVKDGPVIHEINTAKISFVLCGAFSGKAHDVAEKNAGGRIGFGASPKTAVQPYAKPLGAQDLIDFGVMPEFMGRIQRIVSLEPMTAEDYYRMTGNSFNFDLAEYYPYIVPRESLRIVEVSVEECDDSRLDDYNERMHQRNLEFF